MAKKKIRRSRRRTKKVSIFWPIITVVLGILLIIGCVWIYRIFSEKEKISIPKIRIAEEKLREVELYFASEDAKGLMIEKRQIIEESNLVKTAKAVVEELIRGPRAKHLSRTIAPQAKLRSLYLDFNESTAYVDFTENIAKYSPGGSSAEILSVYSAANTLIKNFPEINQVKILINGEEVETLFGHIDLSGPIGFNDEVIKKK